MPQKHQKEWMKHRTFETGVQRFVFLHLCFQSFCNSIRDGDTPVLSSPPTPTPAPVHPACVFVTAGDIRLRQEENAATTKAGSVSGDHGVSMALIDTSTDTDTNTNTDTGVPYANGLACTDTNPNNNNDNVLVSLHGTANGEKNNNDNDTDTDTDNTVMHHVPVPVPVPGNCQQRGRGACSYLIPVDCAPSLNSNCFICGSDTTDWVTYAHSPYLRSPVCSKCRDGCV